MINKAMFVSQNKLNEFTKKVKNKCLKDGKCLVKLRNGTFVEIVYTFSRCEGASFHTEQWNACWNMDGSSFTRDDFDMVEATF